MVKHNGSFLILSDTEGAEINSPDPTGNNAEIAAREGERSDIFNEARKQRKTLLWSGLFAVSISRIALILSCTN